MPDLGSLELLVAVVRTGSISAAARDTGVTQQSASARLRAVERQLGLSLFHRTPSGSRPTLEGEVVASWADDVLAAAGRFQAATRTLRGESSARLTVAASQTVSARLLPRWLVALRRHQLGAGRTPTAVQLLSGNSADAEALVREGRADLAFIESSEVPADLGSTTVDRDELVLVVAPGHPWIGHGPVAFEVAAAEPLVAREQGSGTRRAWEDEVRRRLDRAAAEPAVVLPTSAAVRSAVADGLGAAVLSRREAADDIRLGRLRAVRTAGDPIVRPITALWRGGARDLPPAGRELIDVAVRTARDQGRPGS
ncbi:LysR family transcriptional regulator [Microbacterium sp. 8M]|uniref:LysR family transcriptional regulator n=1 Tax=Microbacterium sp. 8M TaxID=2653153 RepID=UPI001357E103|nr:LysR family transcriptional regulator [Microbacterium sp. 8M]